MTSEEREHIDFKTYQANRRHMCWCSLGMMLCVTAATIYDPSRMEAAESILMAQFLALSGLVASYFVAGGKER
jgi:hypothetical protein